METVITIIGRSDRPLDAKDIEAFRQVMQTRGMPLNKVDWLSEKEACDLYTETSKRDVVLSKWASSFAKTLGIDAIAQPLEGRRKKALFADMESTIIQEEILELMAEYAGVRKQVAEITHRAMNGDISSFREALAMRLGLLKEISADIVEEIVKRITLSEGACELVTTMRANGCYCVLVTGGFSVFTKIIAEKLGFHEHYSNILDIENGKITGKLVDPVIDKEGKLNTLLEVSRKIGVSVEQACAVGDGANDLPMLMTAGLGVAWRAKPKVQDKAHHIIRFADLRSLLWAQGYRKEEIKK